METTSRKDWGDLIKDWLDQIKYCFYYLTWLTHMHKWTRAHTCVRALHTHTRHTCSHWNTNKYTQTHHSMGLVFQMWARRKSFYGNDFWYEPQFPKWESRFNCSQYSQPADWFVTVNVVTFYSVWKVFEVFFFLPLWLTSFCIHCNNNMTSLQRAKCN